MLRTFLLSGFGPIGRRRFAAGLGPPTPNGLAHLPMVWCSLCLLLAPAANAADLTSDETFVVTNKNQLGATGLDAPSVNDQGDIVVRVTTASGTEHRVFLFNPGSPSTAPGYSSGIVVRSSPYTLSRYPVINNHRSLVSQLTFNLGNQNLYRYDFDGTSYNGVLLAQGNGSGARGRDLDILRRYSRAALHVAQLDLARIRSQRTGDYRRGIGDANEKSILTTAVCFLERVLNGKIRR